MDKIKAAILGPGNIGTDLMYKIMRSRRLKMEMMAGIVESPGIQREIPGNPCDNRRNRADHR